MLIFTFNVILKLCQEIFHSKYKELSKGVFIVMGFSLVNENYCCLKK